MSSLRLTTIEDMDVFALTDKGNAELKSAGADDYVTKPFEPEAVTMAVKAVLGLAPAPESKPEGRPK